MGRYDLSWGSENDSGGILELSLAPAGLALEPHVCLGREGTLSVWPQDGRPLGEAAVGRG